MSMETKEKIFKSYFGNVTTKYCDPKKGNKITFHDTIQNNKDYIFNFFDKQPYYNELMPIILKNDRGTHYYKKIIRKGLEVHSDFFKNILKAIKNSKEEESPKLEKDKKINYYKIPKLEILKRRKKNLDKYFLNKNKSKTSYNKIKPMKKNKTMNDVLNTKNQQSTESILKSNNIDSNIDNKTLNNFNNTNYNLLNNTITADTFHTNKNESMSNFNSNYSFKKNKFPTFYITRNPIQDKDKNQKENFNKSFRKNKKFVKLNNILNKCNDGLNFAENLGDDVEKSHKSKSIEEISKKIKNVLENRDKKVIEDRGLGNKKYRELEKEKFNELKRKMDLKVSDVYAYINRKELNDFMRDNDTIYAYQIYYKEMNKINEKLAKKKEIEKKTISTVKDLLENTYRQKEFLKYKIDKYYIKNAKQNQLKIFHFKKKDDFYLNKNNNKEELKGSLLPKLFKMKEFCYGRTKYNPIADLQNIYNEK